MIARTRTENARNRQALQPVFLDDKDAAFRYALGVNTLRAEAEKAGAVVKVGRRRLNRIDLLDKHFGLI